MLRSASALIGFRVESEDGPAGEVVDALFDDQTWTTGYVLLDIGQALTPRRVLLNPGDIEYTAWDERWLRVAWTQAELEARPGPSSGHPESGPQGDPSDLHLRSMQDLLGYQVRGKDGSIGRVADLLIDDRTWAVVDFLVESGDWWQGEKLSISPSWVRLMEPGERVMLSSLDRRTVREGPSFQVHEQFIG